MICLGVRRAPATVSTTRSTAPVPDGALTLPAHSVMLISLAGLSGFGFDTVDARQ
jgi:hypothetical protein